MNEISIKNAPPVWAILLPILVLWCGPSFAQFTINAQTDKTEVHFGESLNLILTVTQEMSSFSGTRLSPPQINEIPGFDIVSRRSSQNITMINNTGQVQLQTHFELVPQKAGDMTIPAFSFKAPDGKNYSTNAIRVKILPPAKASEEEEEKETSASQPEESEEKGGIGFFKGVSIIVFVIMMILGAPILLSWLLNRDFRPSKRWEPELTELLKTTEKTETVQTSPSPPVSVDFEREVRALKQLFPEAGGDFYRSYFDIFHRAILFLNPKLDISMTPDELIRHHSSILPPPLAAKLKHLGMDWEAVVFAKSRPSRSFSNIHEDATAVLQTPSHRSS